MPPDGTGKRIANYLYLYFTLPVKLTEEPVNAQNNTAAYLPPAPLPGITRTDKGRAAG